MKRLTITYGGTTAGSTAHAAYSGDGANGYIGYFTHVPGTVVPPTTAVMTLSSRTNGVTFWNAAIGSTEAITRAPRQRIYDSTGVQSGATTSFNAVPFALVDEEVSLALVGATSASVAGTVYVYVEGY